MYTPVEVVDYIIRSVEDLLNEKFAASLSDEGVHVLDPFVGTGTFITRLMRSEIISPEDLPRKYDEELHANDIMLLAYYVAAINIESTYHDLVDVGEYIPFNGIVLTDTFQSYEEGDPMDEVLFPHNNKRIERQKALDIRVVLGNPPWSATDNRNYKNIDQKVKDTYAEKSDTAHLSAIYDPYVKAIRLASDRIQENKNGGIVAFVTNGGFIDSNSFDGFRKAVAEEFHDIYCFNLRGNANTSGERRKKEGGGIFGANSKAGVGILLMVEKPGESKGATLHYCDIGDGLSRDEKLVKVRDSRLSDTKWTIIEPNEAGDWINQRSEAFTALRPLSPSEEKSEGNDLAPIFNLPAPGLITGRDTWCYNSSSARLKTNIENSIQFYNDQVTAFQKTNPTGSAPQREKLARECRHIHRHSRFRGNPKAIGSKCVFASYRIPDSRFRGDDGNRRLETDILKLTTLPRAFATQDPHQFHWYEKNYREMGERSNLLFRRRRPYGRFLPPVLQTEPLLQLAAQQPPRQIPRDLHQRRRREPRYLPGEQGSGYAIPCLDDQWDPRLPPDWRQHLLPTLAIYSNTNFDSVPRGKQPTTGANQQHQPDGPNSVQGALRGRTNRRR